MPKILLIESDSPFAQGLATAIEARGLEARVTGDGKEGLDLARVDRPDLIVLCVELPRMSGYSVCNKLKKDDQLKSIPLVIISAEATPETFEQHRKLKTRAEGYLIKPFDAASLLKTIEGLVALPPEPAEVSSEELVTLDDVDLETLGPDTSLQIAEGASAVPTSSEDEDLRLLDEAFESLSSEESAVAAVAEPLDESAVAAVAEHLDGAGEMRAAAAVPQNDAVAHPEIDRLGEEADAALAALGVDEPPEADLASSAAFLDDAAPTTGDGVGTLGSAIGQTAPALGPAPDGASAAELQQLQDRISELLAEVARANEAFERRGGEVAEALARQRALEAELEAHRAGARRIEEQSRAATEDQSRLAEAASRAEEGLRVAGEAARRAEERARALEMETRSHVERAQREEQTRRVAEAAAATGSERARAAEERTHVAEERARAAEERTRVAEERTRAAENGFQAAEERVLAAEQRTHSAEARASTAEARTSAAEARAETSEQESSGLKLRLEEAEQALSLKTAEAEQARERGEGLARELDAARARVTDHENELAALHPEMEALRAELAATRTAAEGSRAELAATRTAAEGSRIEAESKLAELRKRSAELEAQNTRHEERVVKAYQKIKGDEKIREKTRKALAIALQLLEERPQSASPAEVQPRRE